MMIVLDIDLSAIPKDKIRIAENGRKYIKFCLTEMMKPDKFGNEYTIYVQQSREERLKVSRTYVGKGKKYDFQKSAPKPEVNDFPDDLAF